MLTYTRWRKSVIDARVAKYDCTRDEADFFTRPDDWWSLHIKPALDAGEMLTKPVCRSIARNGGGLSLVQISKFYPGQMPVVIFKTGKVPSKGDWRR